MEILGIPLPALLSQLLLGLVNGSFYAILSLGLAVIFGMLNVINFTHGAQFMMGAFAAWLMLGYLDDPQATAAAIDADGWLHTGDVGAVDEAGNLRITDRIKDMYICGGFNVYPAEIEQVLARMNGVADAAVIGVPDHRLGEVGRAFVVPRPGANLNEESVIAYTREHLANFKTPRSVRFVDALPRNPGGKVVKPQLRELD